MSEEKELFEWVKASPEDLPDNVESIFIRNTTTKNGGMISVSVLKPMLGMPNTDSIEWLKPIQSSSKEESGKRRDYDLNTVKEGVCKEATMFYKDKVAVKFQDPTEEQFNYLIYADTVIREKESSLTPKSIRDSDGWISVKDRLPKKYKSVTINFKGMLSRVDGKVCEGWYDGNSWDCFALLHGMNEKITVTHWQPLPAPPNEKSASLKPNKITDSAEEENKKDEDGYYYLFGER